MAIEPQTEEIKSFWKACREKLPGNLKEKHTQIPEAWGFGDGPAMADELGALVLSGRKTATCGLLWEYEAENETIPQPGDLSIIIDGGGHPMCLIETTEVQITPYEEVDAQFAFDEGEGDRSLAFWRSEHWKFFSRYLAEVNRKPEKDMPLVCERFRLLVTQEDLSEAD